MTDILASIDDAYIDIKRQILKEYYNRLTIKQREVFHRIWKSLEDVPEKHLNNCISLCERTLKKDGKSTEYD